MRLWPRFSPENVHVVRFRSRLRADRSGNTVPFGAKRRTISSRFLVLYGYKDNGRLPRLLNVTEYTIFIRIRREINERVGRVSNWPGTGRQIRMNAGSVLPGDGTKFPVVRRYRFRRRDANARRYASSGPGAFSRSLSFFEKFRYRIRQRRTHRTRRHVAIGNVRFTFPRHAGTLVAPNPVRTGIARSILTTDVPPVSRTRY